MKTVIGAVLEECGLVSVSTLVIVVPQLVMDRDKIFIANLNAHLQANIFLVIDIPGAGVTDHIAVAGFQKQGPLPEGILRRREAERRKEIDAGVDHAQLVNLVVLEKLSEVIALV